MSAKLLDGLIYIHPFILRSPSSHCLHPSYVCKRLDGWIESILSFYPFHPSLSPSFLSTRDWERVKFLNLPDTSLLCLNQARWKISWESVVYVKLGSTKANGIQQWFHSELLHANPKRILLRTIFRYSHEFLQFYSGIAPNFFPTCFLF